MSRARAEQIVDDFTYMFLLGGWVASVLLVERWSASFYLQNLLIRSWKIQPLTLRLR